MKKPPTILTMNIPVVHSSLLYICGRSKEIYIFLEEIREEPPTILRMNIPAVHSL